MSHQQLLTQSQQKTLLEKLFTLEQTLRSVEGKLNSEAHVDSEARLNLGPRLNLDPRLSLEHLSLSEFLLLREIPDHRRLIGQGQVPPSCDHWLDQAAADWLRSPRYSEAVNFIIDYANHLDMMSGRASPSSTPRRFEFIPLLSELKAQELQELVRQLLTISQNASSFLLQSDMEGLNSLLESHQKMLSRLELPPPVPIWGRSFIYFYEPSPEVRGLEKLLNLYIEGLGDLPGNTTTESGRMGSLSDLHFQASSEKVAFFLTAKERQFKKLIKQRPQIRGQLRRETITEFMKTTFADSEKQNASLANGGTRGPDQVGPTQKANPAKASVVEFYPLAFFEASVDFRFLVRCYRNS